MFNLHIDDRAVQLADTLVNGYRFANSNGVIDFLFFGLVVVMATVYAVNVISGSTRDRS